MKRWKRLQRAWYKCTHWEYWGFATLYIPLFPLYGWLALKARSLFFFNAANPSIPNGGMAMESKDTIYRLLPEGTFPPVKKVRISDSTGDIIKAAASFTYPLIAKPDIGGKGRGVALIRSEQELLSYHRQVPVDYLLQRYCPYPLETGIFYVRDPATGKGRITGVVEKKFPEVTGDGHHNLLQLLQRHKRYALYLDAFLLQLPQSAFRRVLQEGERFQLQAVGNHARGASFFDVTAEKKELLLAFTEKLCSAIPGFHFGRLDIRFNSWEELYRGEKFAIIELNGAGSEPVHMFDPSRSIRLAWKEMIIHFNWLYRVSRSNKQKGARYLSHKEGMRLYRDLRAYDRKLNGFNFRAEDNTVSPGTGFKTSQGATLNPASSGKAERAWQNRVYYRW